MKIFAGDLDEAALTRYVADDFWLMPRTEEANLPLLLKGCRERGIRTILPTRDGELLFWARARNRFAQDGIDVITSPADSIRLCLDKLRFARFGGENGLPFIPAGLHPNDVGPGPYVVKERYGTSACRIGLDLHREAALEHGEGLKNPIYQPFVLGREISIDAWLDGRLEVKGVVLRTRDKIVDGESQVTTTFRDASVESVAANILRALKLRGPVVMQALVDADRNIQIIECNPRFGGASSCSIAAGLDIIHWSLLEARGVDPADYSFRRIVGEVRQIRVPTDIVVHGSDF